MLFKVTAAATTRSIQFGIHFPVVSKIKRSGYMKWAGEDVSLFANSWIRTGAAANICDRPIVGGDVWADVNTDSNALQYKITRDRYDGSGAADTSNTNLTDIDIRIKARAYVLE